MGIELVEGSVRQSSFAQFQQKHLNLIELVLPIHYEPVK